MNEFAQKSRSTPLDSVEPEAAPRARVALAYLTLLALGIAAVWLLVSISLPLRYPFANDTAGYLEEASNFLAGRGLARSGRWSDASSEVVPQATFRPASR
jgi:hypothetical protein